MSEDQEQAVAVEADAGAKPPAEDTTGAPDDLDVLLSEYDKANGSDSEPEQKQESPKDTADKDDRLDRLLERKLAERDAVQQSKADLEKTVKALKGDDLAYLPDDLVEGYLETKSRKDQRLLNAWVDRRANPEKWNKILGSLRQELETLTGGKVDRDQTDSSDAVAAAVRGASTKAPSHDTPFDGKSLGSMSDAELSKLKRSIG
jgi:hypothetical protein